MLSISEKGKYFLTRCSISGIIEYADSPFTREISKFPDKSFLTEPKQADHPYLKTEEIQN